MSDDFRSKGGKKAAIVAVIAIIAILILLIYMSVSPSFGKRVDGWIIGLVRRFYKKNSEELEQKIHDAILGFQDTMKLLISNTINKYISDLLKKIEFIKESRKRKKVQQLFCEKPYSSMLVDIYDNAEMCPSCLCNKKYLDSDNDLTNADNSILLSWNRPSFQYYRKCMSCYNELKICSKRCLYNNLLTNE